MAARKDSSGTKDQQPEALKTFHTAAGSGSAKPKEQGLTAKEDTAPKAKDPSKKNKAAAEVLRAGAEGRPRTIRAARIGSVGPLRLARRPGRRGRSASGAPEGPSRPM